LDSKNGDQPLMDMSVDSLYNLKSSGQMNHNCEGGQGCNFMMKSDSSGPPFNQLGGGVYAFYWTENSIKAWLIPRKMVSNYSFLDKANTVLPSNWESQLGRPDVLL